jgi:hypothetical protein
MERLKSITDHYEIETNQAEYQTNNIITVPQASKTIIEKIQEQKSNFVIFVEEQPHKLVKETLFEFGIQFSAKKEEFNEKLKGMPLNIDGNNVLETQWNEIYYNGNVTFRDAAKLEHCIS